MLYPLLVSHFQSLQKRQGHRGATRNFRQQGNMRRRERLTLHMYRSTSLSETRVFCSCIFLTGFTFPSHVWLTTKYENNMKSSIQLLFQTCTALPLAVSRRDYYTSHNNELVSTHHHPKSTAYSKTFSSFLDFNTCTLLHVCHYTIMERDFIALKVPCAVILYPFLHADLWELPVFSYFHHFAFHTRS